MAIGLLGIGYGFLNAPKDIQEVEKILAAEGHGGHGEVKHEAADEAHAASASHDEVKETNEVKEHEEHLTHVLHQLQNKPWAALYVACIFFMLTFNGSFSFLCYSTSCTSRLVTSIV